MAVKTANKRNVISLHKIEYKQRIINNNINWGFFSFLFEFALMYYMGVTNILLGKIFYILWFVFFLYYIYLNIKSASIYIYKIFSIDDKIEIYYYYKNTEKHKLICSKDTMSVEWYGPAPGDIYGPRLIIRCDDKKIVQYSGKGWKVETIKKVYDRLKEVLPKKQWR